MSREIRRALDLWGLDGSRFRLFAQRENHVWRIDHEGQGFALRIHRPGYRDIAELESEFCFMQHLAAGGLAVPEPVRTRDGNFFATIGARYASLVTWMSGTPVGSGGKLTTRTTPHRIGRMIGAAAAQMHDLADSWKPQTPPRRPDWRVEGLFGDAPVWGRFWEHPHLTPGQRDVMMRVRQVLRAHLLRIESTLDEGLVHADLVGENMLLDDDRIAFIDFDDCAFGYRDFDLATILVKFHGQPGFDALKGGLLEGYGARRAVNPLHLDLLLLARALTYPGWIAARLDEPGSLARSARMLETALQLARDYLKGRHACDS